MPQDYLDDLLKRVPAGCEELGVNVNVQLVPEALVGALTAWSGRHLPEGQLLTEAQRSLIERSGDRLVDKHAWGWLELSSKTVRIPADAFLERADREASPGQPVPAPPSVDHPTPAAGRRRPSSRGKTPPQAPPPEEEEEHSRAEELLGLYLEARSAGQTDEEALAATAAGYGEDVEQVKAELCKAIEEAQETAQTPHEHERFGRYLKLWRARRPPTPVGRRLFELPVTPDSVLDGVRGAAAQTFREQRSKSPARAEAMLPQQLVPGVSAPPRARPMVGLGLQGPGATAITTPNVADFFANRGPTGASHLVKPPGLPGREGVAGAGEDDPPVSAPGEVTRLAEVLEEFSREQRAGQQAQASQVVHAIEGLRRAQEDDKAHSKGTLGAIRRGEELDVYLARGCDTLTVEVCAGLLGKELFHGLKRACEHAKHLMQQVRWPTTVTNRMAYGVAAMAWGGKDHRELPAWSLSAADFPRCKAEAFDGYAMPADTKLEQRPRHPPSVGVWRRQVENQIRTFECVYGVEHGPERREALSALVKAHEEDDCAFPAEHIYGLWEELCAAWCEQLRERRRELTRLLNTDNPRKEDLKFLALAPDASGAASWKFPNVFDLGDPQGYYQTICVPRQTRAVQRYINQQIHKTSPPKKAGKLSEDKDTPAAAEAPAGAAERAGAPAAKAQGAEAQGPPKAAYPAGKRLATWEIKRSAQHAPQDAKGKLLCWDNSCWVGCKRSAQDCAHSHEVIKGLKNLDWTVVAQILKRGGLKSGPKVEPSAIDGRVQQLREQAKNEEASKKEKAGWAPPEEYAQLQLT